MTTMPGKNAQGDFTLDTTLTREEYETLVLMLGMATGVALSDHDNQLSNSFVRLSNKLNLNNPDWRPYTVPDDNGSRERLRGAQEWMKGKRGPLLGALMLGGPINLSRIEMLELLSTYAAHYSSAAIAEKDADIERLKAVRDQLKQQAQIQAQEMHSQRSTVREIYQVATGSTGEPGDWNGAAPVTRKFAALDELRAALDEAGNAIHNRFCSGDGHDEICERVVAALKKAGTP